MKTILRLLTVSALALTAWQAQAATADHLVISEVGMNGSPNSEGEYVEIFNPTTGPVDLTDYWMTDRNEYSALPSDADGMFDVGNSDNIVRFPAGAILASGQVAVIVGKASAFLGTHYEGSLANYTGQEGSPLLFEVFESDAAVDNMITHNSDVDEEHAFTPYNWNFTNASGTNGEHVRLFWWDGNADLVKDVDVVSWGFLGASSSNAPQPKSPATSGGKNGATYLQDNGGMTNLSVGDVDLAIRVTILEDGEPDTGGNGITGHDESMENNSTSWMGGSYPNDASPGRTSLAINTGNLSPFINSADRSIQYPGSGDTITLSAEATDTDGTVDSVNFMLDTGTGFAAVPGIDAGSDNWTADIGPFADNTVIRYYVEATDNGGAKKTLPLDGALSPRVFVVDDEPIVPGDLVINEVLFNNQGGDKYEWVELYNTRSTPLDLSYVQLADATKVWFSFPPNTTIPGNGYLIATLDADEFTTVYGALPTGVQLFDWGTFGLNNESPDTIYLLHVNGADFNNVETYLDIVNYHPNNTEGWPAPNIGNDQTLELIDPTMDNSLPESWAPNANTEAPYSTPGLQNSVSSVSDWSVY